MNQQTLAQACSPSILTGCLGCVAVRSFARPFRRRPSLGSEKAKSSRLSLTGRLSDVGLRAQQGARPVLLIRNGQLGPKGDVGGVLARVEFLAVAAACHLRHAPAVVGAAAR